MELTNRYFSLDVFRGATVAFMILVNNPGTWSRIFDPLEHASWHGLTPTDLVFPFFLFAVGNAIAFVLPRLRDEGDSMFWKKITKRMLLIFFIGTFINWFPFIHWVNDELVFRGWEWINGEGEVRGVRIMGTLQRIAICYFFASILAYYATPKATAIIAGLVLLSYWIICIAMNPMDPFSFEGWFGKKVDIKLLGVAHVYRGDGIPFENEGIVSTFPAIAQVIFGFLVGDYIRRSGQKILQNKNGSDANSSLYRVVSVLFVCATLLLLVGYLWSLHFPVNKKIQSSSFIMIATGVATLTLSTLIYFIEIKGKQGFWTAFFNVFGKNALFIYSLSELLPRLLQLIRTPTVGENGQIVFTSPLGWFYQNICAQIPGVQEIGSLVYAICIVFVYWVIGYWMHRKRIYLRV
jgi:predicted acyltransferase